ncbi:receptor-type tyrosine-protein phosphatase epsilon-like [Diadema setosum]|uniref:receptor-type tyrosine-protein phosphatase epsilon-like n=1 Tax=Diadema setosum TaxID=31175 RepID=UPI003B3B65BA
MAEGPNKASLDDFWRMVWQKRVRVIVMLTNLQEGMRGRIPRRVCQYHYRAWPDKDIPRHSASLLKFLRQVRAEYDGGSGSPLLVHCSDGVGRTAVAIAIDSILAHARRTQKVEVYKCVKSMRERRPYMVQTLEQYEFVYNAVLEDLLWEETEIPAQSFSLRLARLKQHVRGGMQSGLNQEFQARKVHLNMS